MLFTAKFVLKQDLESQVRTGEEELGQVKRQAEETEGNLRQTVEQLNEVSSMLFLIDFRDALRFYSFEPCSFFIKELNEVI